MLKKLLTAAFAVAVTFAFTPKANALLITSNADVEAVSLIPAAGPPLPHIEELDGSGHIYTNQVTDSAFTVGASLRTISANTLSSAIDGTTYLGLTSSGANLFVITGVEGSITSNSGGLVTALFTTGKSFVVEGAAGFDTRNPETWSGSTIIATYDLKPQEQVVPGPVGTGITVAYAADETNISAAVVTTPQTAKGTFLFTQVEGNFLNDVDTSVIPPGYIFESTSFVSDISQTVLFASDFGAIGGGPFGAADLFILNLVASLAGLSDIGTGDSFAGGLGAGPQTNFNPNSTLSDGDFLATLGVKNYIAVQAVTPEPSSFALLGLGVAGLIGYRVRRRK